MNTPRITDWVLGESGVVSSLDDSDPMRLTKLLSLGILPGCEIKLVRRYPAFIVEVEHARFALDHELASGICVSRSR